MTSVPYKGEGDSYSFILDGGPVRWWQIPDEEHAMSVETIEKKAKNAAARKPKDGEMKNSVPAKAKATKPVAAKHASPIPEDCTAKSSRQRSTLSHEDIAALAHQFFEERHRQHGFDELDWFRAEQELLKTS